MNLKEFRDQYPDIKPHNLINYEGKSVEVISWPFEEDPGTIENKYPPVYVYVRMTPGDPMTLKKIQISGETYNQCMERRLYDQQYQAMINPDYEPGW